jgi:6-phosphogluconolactonase
MRHAIVGCLLASALFGLALEPLGAAAAPDGSGTTWVFVGTYTGKTSKGIYRFELDLATGKLSGGDVAAEVTSPSFLAVHPSQRFLYAVGEINNFEGKKEGAISAFSLDPKTGAIKLLNQQSSGGPGPCHLTVDATGMCVLAANYSGGSVVALPIAKDGTLGKATSFHQHKGKGTNPKRQEAPHAHSINVDKDNRFAMAADLGLDQVLIYKLDAAKGTLTPNYPPHVSTRAGAGPRHFAFNPVAPYAYVINELDSTVTVFAYDAAKGQLTPKQHISTLPEGFKGGNSTAEVQVHPSGKFLYGSNRGHDSIACFRIDDKGELSLIGHQGEGIKTPRNFGIDPTGTYLLAASQNGDSIIVFRIDAKTGELKPTGHKASVPTPVCVKFVPKG